MENTEFNRNQPVSEGEKVVYGQLDDLAVPRQGFHVDFVPVAYDGDQLRAVLNVLLVELEHAVEIGLLDFAETPGARIDGNLLLFPLAHRAQHLAEAQALGAILANEGVLRRGEPLGRDRQVVEQVDESIDRVDSLVRLSADDADHQVLVGLAVPLEVEGTDPIGQGAGFAQFLEDDAGHTAVEVLVVKGYGGGQELAVGDVSKLDADLGLSHLLVEKVDLGLLGTADVHDVIGRRRLQFLGEGVAVGEGFQYLVGGQRAGVTQGLLVSREAADQPMQLLLCQLLELVVGDDAAVVGHIAEAIVAVERLVDGAVVLDGVLPVFEDDADPISERSIVGGRAAGKFDEESQGGGEVFIQAGDGDGGPLVAGADAEVGAQLVPLLLEILGAEALGAGLVHQLGGNPHAVVGQRADIDRNGEGEEVVERVAGVVEVDPVADLFLGEVPSRHDVGRLDLLIRYGGNLLEEFGLARGVDVDLVELRFFDRGYLRRSVQTVAGYVPVLEILFGRLDHVLLADLFHALDLAA